MKKERKKNYIRKLKEGDLIKTELSGVPGIHVCMILEDERAGKLVKCLPICNFTSNPPKNMDIAIDVSDYNLPEEYFNLKKSTSWLICKENLCSYPSSDYIYLDNLLINHPKLWEKICNASSKWESNKILTSVCKCERVKY